MSYMDADNIDQDVSRGDRRAVNRDLNIDPGYDAQFLAQSDRRSRTYRALNHRNMLISVLRWILPLMGIAVMVVLIGQSILANIRDEFGASSIRVDDNTIVIGSPRYQGTLSDGSNYFVTADIANVAVNSPDVFDLGNAHVLTQALSGYEMVAEAQSANLDLTAGVVKVAEIMRVSDSDGVAGTFSDVTLDWAAQNLVSQGAVDLKFEDGAAIIARGATYDSVDGHWTFSDAQYSGLASANTANTSSASIISAKNLNFERAKGTAQFSENVHVQQGKIDVYADILDVNFGAESLAEIADILARGNVRLVDEHQTISGDQADYDPAGATLRFDGNVVYVGESGKISAPQLTSALDAGVTRFGGERSSVHGEFQAADPVDVVADSFEVRRDDNIAIFSGNVIINQPDLRVDAQRVIVHMSGDGNQIGYFEALGNVRVRDGQQDARGERARYDPVSRLLRLNDNVQVTNNSGTVRAGELVVDLRQNISTFSGAPGNVADRPANGQVLPEQTQIAPGRVTGVFTQGN